MHKHEKQVNKAFFQMVLDRLSEGGIYLFPAIGQSYTKVGGRLSGTAKAIKAIKDITPTSFHKHLVVGGE